MLCIHVLLQATTTPQIPQTQRTHITHLPIQIEKVKGKDAHLHLDLRYLCILQRRRYIGSKRDSGSG